MNETDLRRMLDLPAEQSADYASGVAFPDLLTFLGSKMGKVYVDLYNKHQSQETTIEELSTWRDQFIIDYEAFQAEYTLYKINTQTQIDGIISNLGTLEDFQAGIQETVV
jgi:hypothetical protein